MGNGTNGKEPNVTLSLPAKEKAKADSPKVDRKVDSLVKPRFEEVPAL